MSGTRFQTAYVTGFFKLGVHYLVMGAAYRGGKRCCHRLSGLQTLACKLKA